MTDGNFNRKHEIILGLECFYRRRKSKMADKREERNLLYKKKAKKLEVRECVVCFFLVFESI